MCYESTHHSSRPREVPAAEVRSLVFCEYCERQFSELAAVSVRYSLFSLNRWRAFSVRSTSSGAGGRMTEIE